MKKVLTVLMTAVLLMCCVLPSFAAGTVVFTDQDFTVLRSQLVSKMTGGVEAIGAYDEFNWKFSGGCGYLHNKDGYKVGYITYKVSAPAGEVLDKLTLDLTGRISTYTDANCEWNAQELADPDANHYWMRVYVFKDKYDFNKDEWTAYEDNVAALPPMEPDGGEKEYSFDLSKKAAGAKDAYVTIATYCEWTPDWIGFSHLTLSGSTVKSSGGTTTKGNTTDKATTTTAATTKATTAPDKTEGTDATTTATDAEITDPTEADIPDSSPDSSTDEDVSGEAQGEETDSPAEGGSAWKWIIPVAAVLVIGVGVGLYFFLRRKK